MDSFLYPHLPARVHLALFDHVSNAAHIRERIVRASQLEGPEGDREREAVNFAFIDARLITSMLHLQTAIYQAILAEVQGALRTKTVHSEILWALSPNNNITEAIRRFGVSDNTTALIVVRVGPSGVTDIEDRTKAVVTGDLLPLSDLTKLTDWATVRKYYKLNADPALKAPGMTPAQQQLAADEIVVSTVAMKSVAT
ncbi:CGI-121-domain-containing protein [Fomitopsis serialis]|uniref:CGI-121-domain-containing protein n=1 Tax=Fomitopsis serialis TaxID=139415 RepID=UPI002008768F|nr:CGI-121-domain-containing protein [Neoantrodia serialis]KAH9916777.1 CGI-121-domain-containing protein [Neoantrodia serialis]